MIESERLYEIENFSSLKYHNLIPHTYTFESSTYNPNTHKSYLLLKKRLTNSADADHDAEKKSFQNTPTKKKPR